MTAPLALICYDHLLPGSQLVNRLQDIGYRVQAVADPAGLALEARNRKPLVILADLINNHADVCVVLREITESAETGHIPILAFAESKNKALQSAGLAAGAKLVSSYEAVLVQLPQLLEQVLQVE